MATRQNQVLMDASLWAVKEHEFYEKYELTLPNATINLSKFMLKNGYAFNQKSIQIDKTKI